ncbi:RNA polymerase sigma factor [Propionibacteriaceae bacterium Y1700]|uniref:RNA polymerase sigma factor n=1 Tax=Microlunatus sp. Y1700 TaxID=3418487 RepID=UPI003DA7709E
MSISTSTSTPVEGATVHPHPARDPFVHTLNTEWIDLVQVSGDTVARWAETHPVFGVCRTLDDVLEAIRSDADGCLYALLVEVRQGDQLAGRVVVQTMLPKMISQARRDADAAVADYVAQLWVRVRTYPLENRPTSIAANLALDTLKAIKAERALREQPWDDDQPCGLGDLATSAAAREHLDHNAWIGGLTAQRVICAAAELGLIDEQTHEVLRTVYADGLSGQEAADRLGTTVDLVRWRCSKAVRRLAQNAEALALAA